jgi:hypothetical protein
MLRELMEQVIGAVDDIKAVEPFEKSARVEVRFSKINSAMRAVTDLQGMKFFDRPLMLAFSRGGASESPEKVQPTPPPASAISAAQWRQREEQTPLTTDEEDHVTAIQIPDAFLQRCSRLLIRRRLWRRLITGSEPLIS